MSDNNKFAPRFVGIDLSINSTGVAVWDGSTVDVTTVKSTKPAKGDRSHATFFGRCDEIVDGIMSFVDFNAQDFVAIEGLSLHSKSGELDRIFALWWHVVRELGRQIDSPLSVVTPQQRAKFATGSGAAKKDVVMLAAARRYPNVEITGNDEADAVVICDMIATRCGYPIADVPKAHLDVLDRVVWAA